MMKLFAVLCLAAVALAKPQLSQVYKAGDAKDVTTVTERTFTVRGDADKYYGAGYNNYYNGYTGYNNYNNYNGYTGYAAQPQAYSNVAGAYQAYSYPAYQHAYHHAAPVSYSAVTAAPAVAYHAAPAVAYNAAPVSYSAVTAAPAVAYHAATVAPAVAYQAAPVSYSAVTAAPAVAYHQTAPVAPVAPLVSIRSEGYESGYDASLSSGADAKVYKHVYAFAAPEEPAVRASVRVQAPVNKRKHYKLVFIKAPSQQTVVDSDITLPAQDEEKTLIYVLSKNQKQIQPEIRIKQAEASKHSKPDVFFLKYKNEAEAQAIASGAISGQTADVPQQGEIISDGSVSLLGQSSGANYGSSYESDYVRSGVAPSNIVYRTGFNSGLSAVSAGTVGIVPSATVVATPATPSLNIVRDAAVPVGFGAGLSSGFSASYNSARSFDQEPINAAVQVVTEQPAEVREVATAL